MRLDIAQRELISQLRHYGIDVFGGWPDVAFGQQDSGQDSG